VSEETFQGFPGIAKATAIPNLFFSSVLPHIQTPDELLAFLWTARLVQDIPGEVRFLTAEQIWAAPGVAPSFEQLGTGEPGLHAGLQACVESRALLNLQVAGTGRAETLYFLNNPASRRTIVRARSGEMKLLPGTVVREAAPAAPPSIFRLYEENIGTITPFVGERLLEAADRYPAEWIEQAFREAAELNARNWRYIERILENRDREGRGNETSGRDTLEDRRQRFLGGPLGSVLRDS
jgi:DNA replication protein